MVEKQETTSTEHSNFEGSIHWVFVLVNSQSKPDLVEYSMTLVAPILKDHITPRIMAINNAHRKRQVKFHVVFLRRLLKPSNISNFEFQMQMKSTRKCLAPFPFRIYLFDIIHMPIHLPNVPNVIDVVQTVT